jgi:3-oxoacyl-[acyl-carrier-protein] synthase III
VIATALSRAGVTPRDIEVFVPHQANQRIIDVIAIRAGLEHCIIADDIKHAGNTSAASIPLALTQLRESGRIRPGSLALLIGFGAGLTIAGQVIRLP